MVVAAIAKRIFGSANDRRVKRYQSKVDAINALEPEFSKLSDAELKAKTEEFKQAYRDGKSLDDLLVPAFATVRRSATRGFGSGRTTVRVIRRMVMRDA